MEIVRLFTTFLSSSNEDLLTINKLSRSFNFVILYALSIAVQEAHVLPAALYPSGIFCMFVRL